MATDPEVLAPFVEPSVKQFMDTWTRLLRIGTSEPHYIPVYDDMDQVIGRAWPTSVGEIEPGPQPDVVTLTLTFSYDGVKP